MPFKKPNIYLIGLGAIGCAFAAQAADHGCQISIICDEIRKAKYIKQPFDVNGKYYNFNYISDISDCEIDLLFISVKFNQLKTALNSIKDSINKNTIIISLLNGINSEELIEEILASKNIIHAFVIGTDSKKNEHQIRFTQNGKIVFGTPYEDRIKLLELTQSYLQHTGFNIQKSDDIIRDMWWKLMLNVGVNQIAALHRAQFGEFHHNSHIQSMTRLAMEEVVELAQNMSINLRTADIDHVIELSKTWGKNGKASMLQDVENKRETEVDILAGEICRLGKKHNIDTPINDFLWHSIKYIEQEY